jgi:glycosyltransferase involved in cell wall biosynthesis
LKIVHALHAFPPFSRAGSENYVEVLAQTQRRRNEVIVFHRIADPERAEYAVEEGVHEGIPVVRINRTFRDLSDFRDSYRSDAVAQRFGEFLDRVRPDVVHFHHVTCLSTTCVHEAHRRGIGVVFTLHDFWTICPRGQRLRRDLSLCDRHEDGDCVRCMAYQLPIVGGAERIVQLDERARRWETRLLPASLRRSLARRPFASEREAMQRIRDRNTHMRDMFEHVHRFVSPSRFLRDRFVEWGLPASRVVVADNGFSPRAAAPRETREGGAVRVAYLGTWIPSKGVHLLVEAFRAIDPAQATLDVHGYAVPFDGFPDYEGHLRRLAGDAPHIRFHGAYGPEDVPGLLGRADVLVVPSLWYENSPLTIHEAFQARVPVIAADHGGMREFVKNRVNGLTFRPGSVADLRRVLGYAIREPDVLRNIASSPSDLVDIEVHAALLERLYGALDVG